LDQATIDYLLLPSPHDRDYAYDFDFVLRVMKIFLLGGSFELNLNQGKRVSKMMDLFLVEVSPDPHLQACEFEALITVLPDTMRESHDQLYLAMDMYLKVSYFFTNLVLHLCTFKVLNRSHIPFTIFNTAINHDQMRLQ
jgi:hypothetical protein